MSTPLHEAAKANDTATIAALIAQGADPNARDEVMARTPRCTMRSGRTISGWSPA